jgi:metal-responsive CopG/Arc/MetJ family transcriptional regulator
MADANITRNRKKRGRPKGAMGLAPAMVVVAIRLPDALCDQMDEWGSERGMTRSASIRRWIENGVNESWKPKEGD